MRGWDAIDQTTHVDPTVVCLSKYDLPFSYRLQYIYRSISRVLTVTYIYTTKKRLQAKAVIIPTLRTD